jgi:hypothetical protein
MLYSLMPARISTPGRHGKEPSPYRFRVEVEKRFDVENSVADC